MKTNVFFVSIFCLGLTLSCGSKSEPATEQKAEQTASLMTETPKTDSSKGDIIASMQGKWQSLDDSKNVIDIKGNNFITIYEGKEVSKEDLDTSAESFKTCAASSNTDLSGQKVFIAKGQFDATCYVLLKVDEKSLEYSIIGGTGNTLKFKKI